MVVVVYSAPEGYIVCIVCLVYIVYTGCIMHTHTYIYIYVVDIYSVPEALPSPSYRGVGTRDMEPCIYIHIYIYIYMHICSWCYKGREQKPPKRHNQNAKGSYPKTMAPCASKFGTLLD